MATPPNDRPVSQTLASTLKFEQNINQRSNRYPIILNTSYPITQSENPLESISRQAFYGELPSWDFTIYEHRLKTFDGVWKLQFITPTQMAKAGLYYVGPQDCVRCPFCSLRFDNWEHGDDPFDEHKRHSPHCEFINDSTDVYDVCGAYTSGPADARSNNESPNLKDFLKSVGILHKMKQPWNKDFATLEARLQSFEKCLIQLKQNIQTLCEAGLYYPGTGTEDYMICYYCGQDFRDWEHNDEPWLEHARWSKTCCYVLLNKGKKFFDEACGEESTKLNATELYKRIVENKDTVITEYIIMKVNSTKKNVDQSVISNIRHLKITYDEKVQLCQKRDPNTKPDSMLCKICYKEEMKVACIPCSHVFACIQCTLSLEQCAMCRLPFDMVMRVHLSMDEEVVKDVEQLPCSSSQCLDVQSDTMLCKVCHKEEMAAVFIPCKHVYACVKCAVDMHECPVCKEGSCGVIQVFL